MKYRATWWIAALALPLLCACGVLSPGGGTGRAALEAQIPAELLVNTDPVHPDEGRRLLIQGYGDGIRLGDELRISCWLVECKNDADIYKVICQTMADDGEIVADPKEVRFTGEALEVFKFRDMTISIVPARPRK